MAAAVPAIPETDQGIEIMLKELCVAALVLAGAAPAVIFADTPRQIEVVKNTRDNPTLYFSGVKNDLGVGQEVSNFLRSCGWFDVVPDPKAQFQLAGSRDGDRIRFDLTQGGAPVGSWQAGAAGSDRAIAKNVVNAIIEKTFKDLKVKGFCASRIAFCAQTAPGVRNIYVCDIDGGNVEQITRFNTLCVEPCWFPDGRSIGYSKYGRTGIDVVQTTLNPRRSRVLSAFRGINAGAAISPDGRQLAVILSPDHQVDLYVMPVGSTRLTRLTRNIAVEASPCWSPDGSQLAYVSDETGSPRIYTVTVHDGSGRKRLPVIPGGRDAVTPDWSKDGKIVYATKVNGNYTIAVYDTRTGENKRATEAPGNWESPAWAADNRQVVCKRADGSGKSALYVVDTWTGKTRLLVATPYNLSMPVWSPCEEN